MHIQPWLAGGPHADALHSKVVSCAPLRMPAVQQRQQQQEAVVDKHGDAEGQDEASALMDCVEAAGQLLAISAQVGCGGRLMVITN